MWIANLLNYDFSYEEFSLITALKIPDYQKQNNK